MEWKQLLNPNRKRQTRQPDDHREQFERDFDRTVFSSPVRRMQDKTQVFPLDPNDSVRTRLTHSMEVSTLARGLARSVSSRLRHEGEIEDGMDRQIEAIAATCGLLHDLGNPPFGHAGEEAITEWFAGHFAKDPALKQLAGDSQYTQDFLRFQGNAQTIRLITKLQVLSDFHGLNLTFGSLSAALKYVSPSNQIDKTKGHEFGKMGYFASENEIVAQIREETGTGLARNPITFLVEAADDMAYSVVDIEDAASKGILTWKKLRMELERKIGASDSVLDEALNTTFRILDIKRGDNEDEQTSDQNYARAFRTAVIGIGVRAVTEHFMKHRKEIMAGEFHKEIVYDSDAKKIVKSCKEIGIECVYNTDENLKLELMGRNLIHDLLTFFWEGARNYTGEDKSRTFDQKIASLFSDNYKDVFRITRKEKPEVPVEYSRLQLVTDYVCGMTDTFAKNLHQQIRNG